jgi:hypothetical protein
MSGGLIDLVPGHLPQARPPLATDVAEALRLPMAWAAVSRGARYCITASPGRMTSASVTTRPRDAASPD